jgi:hypothetical protein
MKWTQTTFVRTDGLVEIVPDDWALENDGSSLARIYRVRSGPQHSKWFWAVMICPSSESGNGETGYAPNVREARRQCEGRLPEEINAAIKQAS